jgi:hypothetical protein
VVRRRRSGRLDATRFASTLAGNDKAFYQRRAPKRVSRRAIIVLDASGSMDTCERWSTTGDAEMVERTRRAAEGSDTGKNTTAWVSRWSYQARLALLQVALCRSAGVEVEVWCQQGRKATLLSTTGNLDALRKKLLYDVHPRGGNDDDSMLNAMLTLAYDRPETDVAIFYYSDGGWAPTPDMLRVLTSHYVRADRMVQTKRVRLIGVGAFGDHALSQWGVDAVDMTMRSFDEDAALMLRGIADRLANSDRAQRPTLEMVERLRTLVRTNYAHMDDAGFCLSVLDTLARKSS